MQYLTQSVTVSAVEPETEPREEPCFVQQQQDTEDTAPCVSGAENALGQVMRMLGVEIPAPKESETYSSSITIKPKNIYTSLNISMTHGGLSAPTYNSGPQEVRLDVSIGDFRLNNNYYYIDIRSATDLVEADNIKSVAWIGSPIDDNLNKITPQPSISVTHDDLLRSSRAVNGVVLIKFLETTATYKFEINPRDGVESGFYKSNLVINAGGCNDKPFFYEIKSPPCYEHNQLLALLSSLGGGKNVEIPPRSPSGGEEYECKYCLCTGKLQSESVDGMCAGSKEESDSCKSGPNHKDC